MRQTLLASIMLIAIVMPARSESDMEAHIRTKMQSFHELMTNILDKEKNVTMVVIADDITHDGSSHPDCRASLQSSAENSIMFWMSGRDDFKLLERQKLDMILKELRLTYTGLIAKGSAEIGKMIGVNYIFFIDSTHESTSEWENGEVNAKVVKAETGEILYSKNMLSYFNDLTKQKKSIKN